MPKDIETYRSPKLAVDAIIIVDNKVVLIERKNPPLGWAFPGGFVDYGESVEAAIIREVEEETSLKITDSTLEQVQTYSSPNRDPRGHVVSVVFACEAIGVPKAQDDAKNIKMFDINDLPELAFDHKNILECYLQNNPHKIGNKAMMYSADEVREDFLAHIRNCIHYWDTLEGKDAPKTTRDRLEGLAFSICTMLDGCTGLPGFLIAPLPHESDKDYQLDNESKYYPENHHIEDLIQGEIGGSLHELLFHKKK